MVSELEEVAELLKNGVPIHPTHACFDDALDYIGDEIKRRRKSKLPALVLVHAICLKPEDQPDAGQRFAHAWVEEGDLCVDHGVVNGVRITFKAKREEYYAGLRPEAMTRYTVREAALMNLKHGNYGPWEERYIALCKRAQEKA